MNARDDSDPLKKGQFSAAFWGRWVGWGVGLRAIAGKIPGGRLFEKFGGGVARPGANFGPISAMAGWARAVALARRWRGFGTHGRAAGWGGKSDENET